MRYKGCVPSRLLFSRFLTSVGEASSHSFHHSSYTPHFIRIMQSFTSDNYNPLIDDPGFEMDIISAASNGNFRHVSMLLSQGCDVNARNGSGWTPLMYACHYGHFTVVRVLVDADSDVNLYEFSRRRTALMMAAGNGHTRCIEALMSSGKLDLDQKDLDGNTAAYYAIAHGHGDNKVIGTLLRIPNLDNQRQPAFPVTPNRRTMIEKKVMEVSKSPKDYHCEWTNQVNEASQIKAPSIMLEVPSASRLKPSSSRIWQPISHGHTDKTCQALTPSRSLVTGTSPSSTGLPKSPSKDLRALPSCLDDLLDRINLRMYKEVFRVHRVDLYTFPDLTEDDFISIGIEFVGHRRKLLVAQLRLVESVEIRNTQEQLFADYLLIERSRLQEENNRLKDVMMQWRDCVQRIMTSVTSHGILNSNERFPATSTESREQSASDRCL